MNFNLQEIEQHLDADLIDNGLKLLDGSDEQAITEMEKGIWAFQLSNGFEPAIELSRKKIKSHSCDCKAGMRGEFCNHLTALALGVRRKLNKPRPTKSPSKKSNTSKKKINTNNILALAGHEELKMFVKGFARSNRQFSVALKTHFAHLFETDDLHAKYKEILETAIKSCIGRSRRHLTAAKQRKLNKHIDALINQAEDGLARKFYAESFAILCNVIEQVTPLTWNAYGSHLNERVDRAFQLSLQWANSELPPELEREAVKYFTDQAGAFKYRSGEKTIAFFPLLIALYQRTGDLQQLDAFIRFQLGDDSMSQSLTRAWNAFHLNVAELLKDTELVDSILEEAAFDRFLFSRILVWAKQEKRTQIIKQLFGLAKEKNPTILSQISREADRILFDIALEEKDAKTISRLAPVLFMQTREASYYHTLISFTEKKKRKKTTEAFFNLVLNDALILSEFIAISDLMIEEGLETGLLDFISKRRSLSLLKRHLESLLHFDRNKTLEICGELPIHFLNHHVGYANATAVAELVELLAQYEERDFVKKLAKKLIEAFPRRRSLSVQLEHWI